MPVPRYQRALAALSAVAVLGAAGCSSGKEETAAPEQTKTEGTIRIAYLQKQGDQQYFVDQANGAKQAAAGLDAEVTVVNLGLDANKAISEIDTAIAQKFDAIAIVVPDQAVGPQVIDKARAAGIPLVATDDIIKDASGKEAPFVGFDGPQMGQKVGEKAAELYKAAGWTGADTMVLSVSKQDLSVCEDRVQASWKAFQDAGIADVKRIELGTDASVTNSQDKAAAVVTANRAVKHWVVWGCNDESETGAVTAIANAGYAPADIIGVGLGAYLTCKDWKANTPSGNKAALYISGVDVGKAAVEVLVKKVRGTAELPPRTIAVTTMVDPTNWQQTGMQCT